MTSEKNYNYETDNSFMVHENTSTNDHLIGQHETELGNILYEYGSESSDFTKTFNAKNKIENSLNENFKAYQNFSSLYDCSSLSDSSSTSLYFSSNDNSMVNSNDSIQSPIAQKSSNFNINSCYYDKSNCIFEGNHNSIDEELILTTYKEDSFFINQQQLLAANLITKLEKKNPDPQVKNFNDNKATNNSKKKNSDNNLLSYDPFIDYTGIDKMINQLNPSSDNTNLLQVIEKKFPELLEIKNSKINKQYNYCHNNSIDSNQPELNPISYQNNFLCLKKNSILPTSIKPNSSFNIQPERNQNKFSLKTNSYGGNLSIVKNSTFDDRISPTINDTDNLNYEYEDDVFLNTQNHITNEKTLKQLTNNPESMSLELYKRIIDATNLSSDNQFSYKINANFEQLNLNKNGNLDFPQNTSASCENSLNQSLASKKYLKLPNIQSQTSISNFNFYNEQNKKRGNSICINNLPLNSFQVFSSNNLNTALQSNKSNLNYISNTQILTKNIQQSRIFNNNNNSNNNGNYNSLTNDFHVTNNSSIQQTANSIQSANCNKPLRSERLPIQFIEDIIKQAKLRRKGGGKKEVCVFCRNNGEKEQIYTSHTLKDSFNKVSCPILRLYQCPICHASADNAHTIKYCPFAEKDGAGIKLYKDSRMNTAVLLMNSLANNNTPPSSPSPQLINKQQNNFNMPIINLKSLYKNN